MTETQPIQIEFVAQNNTDRNFCYYPQDTRTQLDLAVLTYLDDRLGSLQKGTYQRLVYLETFISFWKGLPEYYKSQMADAVSIDNSA